MNSININWPYGLPVQVESTWNSGDHERAIHNSNRARQWNIAAIALGITSAVIIGILIAISSAI